MNQQFSNQNIIQDLNPLCLNADNASLQSAAEKLITTEIKDISLIKLSSVVSKDELRNEFPYRHIFACDFYVTGIENDKAITGGFHDQKTLITNIDHHSPDEKMFRYVSSGNLAIDFVCEFGPLPKDAITVINHTDCDSVISSLIMRGYLPPHPALSEAVIAADHSGAENKIADLLQAIDPKRDINFSARNLGLLLTGRELEPEAADMLNERMSGRKETEEALLSGAVRQRGPLTVVNITSNMRNEFMPALFPDAAVIFTFEDGDTPDTWIARYRLGMAAPPGFTLFSLNLNDNLDPKVGGRWNAGSNKRGGGTSIPLEDYIAKLNLLVEESLKAQSNLL